MKDLTQIAVKAAYEIELPEGSDDNDRQAVIAIIQSAIEKAILIYGHHEVARLIKESAEPEPPFKGVARASKHRAGVWPYCNCEICNAAHASGIKQCSECGMDSSVGHHKNCKAIAAHASEEETK